MKQLIKRKVFFWSLLAIFLYFVVKKGEKTVSFGIHIKNAKPYDVWEYMADLQNMKHLNPTFMHFRILDQSGDPKDWRYTAEYTEFLSNFPFITNTAVASFRLQPLDNKTFLIHSDHETCFMFGFFCLSTVSDMTFEPIQVNDTFVKEKITLECPRFLFFLCASELVYQRESVFKNLEFRLSNSVGNKRPAKR